MIKRKQPGRLFSPPGQPTFSRSDTVKKILSVILSLCMIGSMGLSAFATEASTSSGSSSSTTSEESSSGSSSSSSSSSTERTLEAPPTTLAASYVVMDASTGQVLISKEKDTPYAPASTTKVFTTALALDPEVGGLNPNSPYTVKVEDVHPDGYKFLGGGSAIAITEGENLTIQDLLYGTMVASGNDAANTLADAAAENGGLQYTAEETTSSTTEEETTEGEENAEEASGEESAQEDAAAEEADDSYQLTKAFVQAMNEKARSLGAVNTNFVNPHGLHNAEQYTTAFDMALLTRYAMKVDKFNTYFAATSYSMNPTNKQSQTRPMNRSDGMLTKGSDTYYDGIIGMKLGYTEESNHTGVAAAKQDGRTLIAVAMNCKATGTGQIQQDLTAILDYCFENFDPVTFTTEELLKQDVALRDNPQDRNLIGRCTVSASSNLTLLLHWNYTKNDVQVSANVPGRYYRSQYPDDSQIPAALSFTLKESARGDTLYMDPDIGRMPMKVTSVTDEEVAAARKQAQKEAFDKVLRVVKIVLLVIVVLFLLLLYLRFYNKRRYKRLAAQRRMTQRRRTTSGTGSNPSQRPRRK